MTGPREGRARKRGPPARMGTVLPGMTDVPIRSRLPTLPVSRRRSRAHEGPPPALLAVCVVVAILAVLTYLWFRFEWQFAVGAIIGTMHDLLLTVGFFSVTQLEFNQTSIAAATIPFDGYPTLVARETGMNHHDVFLMLCFGDMRIVHCTLHVGVAQAVALITRERVGRAIRAAWETAAGILPSNAEGSGSRGCGTTSMLAPRSSTEKAPQCELCARPGIC